MYLRMMLTNITLVFFFSQSIIKKLKAFKVVILGIRKLFKISFKAETIYNLMKPLRGLNTHVSRIQVAKKYHQKGTQETARFFQSIRILGSKPTPEEDFFFFEDLLFSSLQSFLLLTTTKEVYQHPKLYDFTKRKTFHLTVYCSLFSIALDIRTHKPLNARKSYQIFLKLHHYI